MKIALTFLRIELPAGPYYRLAIHRHWESGDGRAATDPRALAASAFGTITQNVTVLAQWHPFDFAIKGGMILDPKFLSDAMIEDMSDTDGVAGLIDRLQAQLAVLIGDDPIPSDGADPKPEPGL